MRQMLMKSPPNAGHRTSRSSLPELVARSALVAFALLVIGVAYLIMRYAAELVRELEVWAAPLMTHFAPQVSPTAKLIASLLA